jgi:hypothetical protein
MVILAAFLLAACGQSEPPSKGEVGPPGPAGQPAAAGPPGPRTAKKSKAKTPKKPPTSNVDAQTPVGPSVASDEALEDAATASKFTGLCA